jgi:hypothetical protein
VVPSEWELAWVSCLVLLLRLLVITSSLQEIPPAHRMLLNRNSPSSQNVIKPTHKMLTRPSSQIQIFALFITHHLQKRHDF